TSVYVLKALVFAPLLSLLLMALESEGFGKLSAASSVVRHALDAIAYDCAPECLIPMQGLGRLRNGRQFLDRLADGPETRGGHLVKIWLALPTPSDHNQPAPPLRYAESIKAQDTPVDPITCASETSQQRPKAA